MSMMKTVLMCACDTGGGVWQEPKVVRPANSGANPNTAMTRFENFMTSSLELPARHCSVGGYVAGGSVSLVLSAVFRVLLADRGAPRIFWGEVSRGHPRELRTQTVATQAACRARGVRPRSGVRGERRRAARAPIAAGNGRPDSRRARAARPPVAARSGTAPAPAWRAESACLRRDLGPAARGTG